MLFLCKLGFVGCGNMGKAMALGALQSGYAKGSEIIFYDIHDELVSELVGLGMTLAEDNEEVAAQSEIIILAVKPNLYDEIIDDIQPELEEHSIILSITPAYTIKSLRERLGDKGKIARSMPNTPAMVGEGMIGVCFDTLMEEEEKEKVMTFFRSISTVIEVKEEMMGGVCAVSGSAPAFIYMLMEAMADSAVSFGIPRADAYTFVAQTVKGSAEMLLQTGIHPGALKDQVTSPGGTTIAGCKELEKQGFRAAMMSGLEAAKKRFDEMEESN